MVVYGQDREASSALFDWLRAIGLAPDEWGDLTKATGSASPFIGQVLDKAFEDAQAVVVLFTPDERVAQRVGIGEAEERWRLQARPNVLFEAGMAFATHSDRTVLVVLGEQALPSDLAGRHYVRLDGTPEALHELANRLETAGCEVNRSGGQWLDLTRFPRRDGIPADPRFGASGSGSEQEPAVNVRLTLLNEIRRGREIASDPLLTLTNESTYESREWTERLIDFLAKHVSPEVAEEFVRLTSDTAPTEFRLRLEYLKSLTEDRDLKDGG
jgi:hypothetical protein